MLEVRERYTRRRTAPRGGDRCRALAVVTRPDRYRQRRADRRLDRSSGDPGRPARLRTRLADADARRRVVGARFALERVDLPQRIETPGNRVALAAIAER